MSELVEITKTYRFEAAHSLPLLPVEHQCHGVHGHSYKLVVGVMGPVDETLKWVQDYGDVSAVVKPLVKRLDHKNLNAVLGMEMTTAENLALWFARELKPLLPMLSRVEVQETETSNAIVRLK